MKAIVSNSSLSGEIRIPGSKSHMIRALYFGALGNGLSTLRNPVRSADALAAASLVRALGISVDMAEDEEWQVAGDSLQPPENVIDVANSGTSMQFGATLLASTGGGAVVTGDDQIRRRPVTPTLDMLRQLGVEAFTIRGNESAPFYLKGPIRGGFTRVQGIVSQYVSSAVVAGVLAESDTEIEVDAANETPYIEMTLQWLHSLGVNVDASEDYNHYSVRSGQTIRAFNKEIPADFSSAAFPLIGAAITNSDVTLRGLDTRDVQGDKILVDILLEMGAKIDVIDHGLGGIRVRGGAPLRGTTVDCSSTPDSVPILSVLGCVTEGETRLVGIESSRLKETDRPLVMAEELGKMGARMELTETSLTIRRSSLTGAAVHSRRDHRVAMALTIAGLIAGGTTVVDHVESATISYPGFDEALRSLGANVKFTEE